MMHLEARVPWSTAAPPPRSRAANQPTLLFSWWCTVFSAAIIITRVLGRKVRSNVLFREDWIMLAALLPLFIRMGCIHVVLIWGTNNVDTVGYHYTPEKLLHHSIGARLVLAARVFYAAFIWTSKWTVSEFLKRITARTWRQSYETVLRFIRAFLLVTFIGVVIATISECQPIDHYWQVVPDPGPSCRQGYAQLLTMGICDIITDILLVLFPIPIILTSGATWQRKLQLAALFSLSLIMIAITALRMPEVMLHHGRQQYRTVWASCEILAAAAVVNAVALGSFLRDKGTKRNKFRGVGSVDESAERASVRRPTLANLHRANSDEDLFRSFGCRIPDHLQEKHSPVLRPALPEGAPIPASPFMTPLSAHLLTPRSSHESRDSMLLSPDAARGSLPQASRFSQSNFDFSDMGGLLDENPPSPPANEKKPSPPRSTERLPAVITLDFASYAPHLPFRGDSTAPSLTQHMTELGVLPSPSVSRSSRSSNDHALSYFKPLGTGSPSLQSSPAPNRMREYRHARGRAPIGVLAPMLGRRDETHALQDAGGLLGPPQVAQPIRLSSRDGHRSRHVPFDVKMSPVVETRLDHQRAASSTRGSIPPSPARRLGPLSNGTSTSSVAPDDLVLHDAGGLALN